MTLFLSANGNLCWRWSEIDPSWSRSGGSCAIQMFYSFMFSVVICVSCGLRWLLKWQHYIKLKEEEKNRKLNDLLDALDFNQVVIFVKSVSRAAELDKLLVECNFPSICIHSGMSQEERFVLCGILSSSTLNWWFNIIHNFPFGFNWIILENYHEYYINSICYSCILCCILCWINVKNEGYVTSVEFMKGQWFDVSIQFDL